jgi:crossover junction endodeoxyribonuclease RuvC
MRILGVDPGTQRTGAGIIEASGSRYQMVHAETITIPQTLPIEEKLRFIFDRLSQIIREYQPQILALENIFYSKNIRSMLKIGEARACAMLAASQHGLGVVEYLPTRIKKAVSSNGRAAKGQVQEMVRILLNLKTSPDQDAADALAVAICHGHYGQFQEVASHV